MSDVRSMPAILFVDDDKEILTLAKIFFESSGMLTVEIATSATMAIGKLNCTKYDGILSDYHMPVMNGIEFLHHVREEFGDIPFILFTSDETPDIFTEAREYGADFCIMKSPELQKQCITLEFVFRSLIELKRIHDKTGESPEKIFVELPDGTYDISTFLQSLPGGYLGRSPEGGSYFYVKKSDEPDDRFIAREFKDRDAGERKRDCMKHMRKHRTGRRMISRGMRKCRDYRRENYERTKKMERKP